MTRYLQAAFLWSCLFVFGCENKPEDIQLAAPEKLMVEEVIQVETLMSQNGKARARLKAPLMYRYSADTSYLEFPRTLMVDFFDSTGAVESKLSALYGKYFETRSTVYLRDSVVVYNIKGDTLRAPDLWWDQNMKKFYTEKEVRIFTKDKRIYGGKGLEAEQDLSRWTIFKPTGIIAIPDSMRID